MPVFTLIAGVNGVGKSSLAGLLLAQSNELGQFLDTNRTAAELGIGKVQAGKMTLNQIRHCLRWGMSFAQETTLSGHQPKETVQKAKKAGFRVQMHYAALDTLEESLARIENRVRCGGHSIPKEDVTRRFYTDFTMKFNFHKKCGSRGAKLQRRTGKLKSEMESFKSVFRTFAPSCRGAMRRNFTIIKTVFTLRHSIRTDF